MRYRESPKVAFLLTALLIGNLHAQKNPPSNISFFQRLHTRHTEHTDRTTGRWTMAELKRTIGRPLASSTTLSFQDASSSATTPAATTSTKKVKKKLVLIRHGCTYMNEYLSRPGSTWGDPNFTDIFLSDHERSIYRDSPLSERGVEQAKQLAERFASSMEDRRLVMDEIEIIAVSPLNRALQTLEIGILPHLCIDRSDEACAQTRADTTEDGHDKSERIEVPIVALPLATERLYLISDIGSSTSILSKRYPFVDFNTEFHGNEEEWWFTVKPDNTDAAENVMEDSKLDEATSQSQKDLEGSFLNSDNVSHYKEWRPIGEGQRYACPGEPDASFNHRMEKLYEWINARDESTICIVCHWGVLEWLTGARFENCEMRIVNFEDMKCHGSN